MNNSNDINLHGYSLGDLKAQLDREGIGWDDYPCGILLGFGTLVCEGSDLPMFVEPPSPMADAACVVPFFGLRWVGEAGARGSSWSRSWDIQDMSTIRHIACELTPANVLRFGQREMGERQRAERSRDKHRDGRVLLLQQATHLARACMRDMAVRYGAVWDDDNYSDLEARICAGYWVSLGGEKRLNQIKVLKHEHGQRIPWREPCIPKDPMSLTFSTPERSPKSGEIVWLGADKAAGADRTSIMTLASPSFTAKLEVLEAEVEKMATTAPTLAGQLMQAFNRAARRSGEKETPSCDLFLRAHGFTPIENAEEWTFEYKDAPSHTRTVQLPRI